MDETEELIQLCVRALVSQMIAAPGVELHLTRSCGLGLTDEPLADFNRLILGDDPDAEDFLVHAVGRATARGHPLSTVMSPRAAQRLGARAMDLGLTEVGAAPLMVLRPEVPVGSSRPMNVVRALGQERVSAAGDLIAAAFDTPRDVIARCIDVGMTATAGVDTYIAWSDEGPLSTVSITVSGDTAGVSLMATAPQRQRKGLGRALLGRIIDDYRRRGVSRFHLGATDAGLPLYAGLGFDLVARLPVWILPSPG